MVFPSAKRKKNIERQKERQAQAKREGDRGDEKRTGREGERGKGRKREREKDIEKHAEGKSTGRVGRGFNRRLQSQFSVAAFQFLKWPTRLLRARSAAESRVYTM